MGEMTRAQDRLRELRRKLLTLMGERRYRIRVNGTVELYRDGWHPIGRWPDVESVLCAPKKNVDGV